MDFKVSSKEAKNILGKLKRQFGQTLDTASKEELYKASALCIRDEILEKWANANDMQIDKKLKRVYYMSAEFLMGRAYVNNLISMGLLQKYEKAFEELGFKLGDITKEEADAGLGNGGLGRLAACFLDSLAALELPAMGCGIRYEYGLFKQKIIDGAQVEVEDNWLQDGCVWEVERPERTVEVHFNGAVDETWDEQGMHVVHKDYDTVLAVAYDMPIIGYKSDYPATLRLWSARANKRFDMRMFNSGEYAKAMQERELAEVISKVLYPADDHDQGKMLRLKQFYFLSSATMQSMVIRHKKRFGDVHSLPKYNVVQINDTHPTLAIPELMRILMDQEGLNWDEAYSIVSQMFNYTNHTILTEALECWDENMFRLLLPRIYSIVQELNRRYCENLGQYYGGDLDKISRMSIVAYGQIRMANLCVAVTSHVNGVSQLHGDILKKSLFADSYKINPAKYLAITNGITHRRWLASCNPGLTALMQKHIKGDFVKDYHLFADLMPATQDPEFLNEFAQIKRQNKQRLADYVLQTQGIKLNVDSVFDVQAKRLHEYKRQLLKCIHILYLYNEITQGRYVSKQPITFIFAAKAAPGYAKAKNIIRLIGSIGDLINSNPLTKELLQVVFIENYSVSAAEVLIPATDISEQISTAGLEASGTGNMKFMMNGAVTMGTMDGANIEIFEQVGKDNIFIFGADATQIEAMNTYHSYHPGEYFEKNIDVRNAVNRLIDGTLPGVSTHQFSDLYQSLLFGDYDPADKYFVLYDFASYAHVYEKALRTYETEPQKWMKMAAANTAMSGFFSSDRTIAEYNEKIWKLKKY